MIDLKKLTLIDGLMYALDEIQKTQSPELWAAFSKYMERRPFQYASDGRKCILASDLQIYIRLRSNALKNMGIDASKKTS